MPPSQPQNCQFSGIVFVLMVGIPNQIIPIFTSDKTLIVTGVRLSQIIFFSYPIVGIYFIGTNLFLSLGKAAPTFILSTSRNYIFIIALIFILPKIIGVNGVWYAIPFADIPSVVIATIFLLREIKSFSIKEECLEL